MNAILGFTDLLKRGYARSEGDHRRATSIRSTRAASSCSSSSTTCWISPRSRRARLEVERIPCATHRIANEVVKVLSVKAAEKGITLALRSTARCPRPFPPIPVRLRQIVTNLVGNALKFTEQGGVRLRLRFDPEQAPGTFAIEVIDTGIGMTPEQAGKIFDPFVQADSSDHAPFRRHRVSGCPSAGVSPKRSAAISPWIVCLVRAAPSMSGCRLVRLPMCARSVRRIFKPLPRKA